MIRRKLNLKFFARLIVIVIISIVVALLLPDLLLGTLRDFREMRTYWLEFLTAIFVVIIGVGMYWIRKNHQAMYGTIEIGIGFGTAFNTAAKVKADIFRRDFFTDDPQRLLAWISLIACIYIVVRGIDNLVQGWVKCSTPNIGEGKNSDQIEAPLTK